MVAQITIINYFCINQESTHSIAEEFTRMVNEVANQPTASNESTMKYETKNVELPIPSTTTSIQPQSNAITSINNNIVKSDILTVNESKNLGLDVVIESNETPIVSAISDSPVIVPKMHTNIKQLQKNCEQNVQSVVLDKNIPPNKHQKQNKNKPVVPHVEETDIPLEVTSVAPQSTPVASVAPIVAITVPAAPTPAFVVATPNLTTMPAPQPQRIREPRDRAKSDEKEKDKTKEKELSQEKDTPVTNKPNGPTPVGK